MWVTVSGLVDVPGADTERAEGFKEFKGLQGFKKFKEFEEFAFLRRGAERILCRRKRKSGEQNPSGVWAHDLLRPTAPATRSLNRS